jgi:hypothetical protein
MPVGIIADSDAAGVGRKEGRKEADPRAAVILLLPRRCGSRRYYVPVAIGKS